MFWEKTHFIDQSVVPLCQAYTDYTCCKGSSLIVPQEFYIKGTLFLSHKTFSVVIIIFHWLLGIEKT